MSGTLHTLTLVLQHPRHLGGGASILQARIQAERGNLICKLSYVERIASPALMNDTGCSGLVHWDDPEGWDGEGSGRGVQDREHMSGVKSMYGKTNTIL